MTEYAQFIFLRDDLESMTRGRMCAMAAHASSIMHECLNSEQELLRVHGEVDCGDLIKNFLGWMDQAGTFGTTYVFGTTVYDNYDGEVEEWDGGEDLKQILQNSLPKDGYFYSVIRDPSYVLKDGLVYHQLPLVTGAVIFAPVSMKDTFKDCGYSFLF